MTTMQAIRNPQGFDAIRESVRLAGAMRQPMYVYEFYGYLGSTGIRRFCDHDYNYNDDTYHPVDGKRHFLTVLPMAD